MSIPPGMNDLFLAQTTENRHEGHIFVMNDIKTAGTTIFMSSLFYQFKQPEPHEILIEIRIIGMVL